MLVDDVQTSGACGYLMSRHVGECLPLDNYWSSQPVVDQIRLAKDERTF